MSPFSNGPLIPFAQSLRPVASLLERNHQGLENRLITPTETTIDAAATLSSGGNALAGCGRARQSCPQCGTI